jgi:hypothetical protein
VVPGGGGVPVGPGEQARRHQRCPGQDGVDGPGEGQQPEGGTSAEEPPQLAPPPAAHQAGGQQQLEVEGEHVAQEQPALDDEEGAGGQ